jgi:hypothetical protein
MQVLYVTQNLDWIEFVVHYITDLTGQRFSRLVVLGFGEARSYGTKIWICKCDCGNLANVSGQGLISGKTRSCGCLKTENAKTLFTTHGQSQTPEYRSWASAKNRVTNPNNAGWEDYGGRGITMCQEWLNDFQAFYDYIGPKPEPKIKYSIDRINNDGNYEPGNVRWATRYEQVTNVRPRINTQTHCKRGHEFTIENTRFKKSNGTRQCKTCEKERYERSRMD